MKRNPGTPQKQPSMIGCTVRMDRSIASTCHTKDMAEERDQERKPKEC